MQEVNIYNSQISKSTDGVLISNKKKTGAHFTPRDLACYVAKNIIKELNFDYKKTVNVLDPSCGDGELLVAFISEVPKKYINQLVIYGIESDLRSIEKAKKRIKVFSIRNYNFYNTDFLNILSPVNRQLSLSEANLKKSIDKFDKIDVIIANPPYVRTQILGSKRSQELAKKFSLTGRVDLYHAFLVAMTNILSKHGIIGVITSNRFISTKGGTSVRKFLYNNYEIIKLVDLGDTKLFTAAVLPAVFFGRKKNEIDFKIKSAKQLPMFFRIYENLNNKIKNNNIQKVNNIYEILENGKEGIFQTEQKIYNTTTGILTITKNSEEPWKLVTSVEKKWIETIERNSKLLLSNIARVRVGIKTTADSVFIRSDWDTLPNDIKPEKEVLKPLLSGFDANRWLPKLKYINRRYVLYTHEYINGKRTVIDLKKYPRANAYLETYRERLEGRQYVIQANRQWYEIWVPQDPRSWLQPKIVFPDISPEPKFFYANNNSVVDGNCYWITINSNMDKDILFLILGIVNSELMTQYHDLCFNNKLYSGRRRYFTQFVGKYPIPDIETKECRLIVSLVKEILFSKKRNYSHTENKLKELVCKAYGIKI